MLELVMLLHLNLTLHIITKYTIRNAFHKFIIAF